MIAVPRVPDWPGNLPAWLNVPYQDFAMIADLHLPYLHTDSLQLALEQAAAAGTKLCVLGGDVVDHEWCAKWQQAYGAGGAPQVEEQIRYVYDVLAAICDVFPSVIWIPGNHDIRPLRALEMRMGFDHWSRIFTTAREPSLAGRIVVAPSPRVTLTGSPTGDWLVCHQRNYSVIPGRTAQRVAAKYDCNVITTHEHVCGYGPNQGSGRWQAVGAPCACDPAKIEYKHQQVTLHPDWVVGWVTVTGGIARIHEYRLEQLARGTA